MLFSQFFTSASVGLLLSLIDQVTASPVSPGAPKLELLYQLNLTLGDALSFGPGPKGTRLSIPITGGEFFGQKLSDITSGKVLNVGADLGLVDGKGTFFANAYYQFQTDDGANILAHADGPGVQNGPHPVTRITPETGSEKYYWLNNVVVVGEPTLRNGSVSINASQIISTA
ncbi:uncharacterized protein LY79DRAFT_584096 [Colletotrichum navitas]|uniref:Uncharacterized protein n=1 Tax=Colletotrichum navitas TaxID=681940 RepID=A0AAD8PME5_9PEZI|nr:uncharacterized protein LY79DRAFT_584096 [Colletotrichum navitas]KAK1572741.1 hypothetical protein LY79DRAFT_584096 [Colletotrichum navitas]